jgi:hypothetical protein
MPGTRALHVGYDSKLRKKNSEWGGRREIQINKKKLKKQKN